MAGNQHSSTALTIRILGRDYPVSCPASERESLLRSAEYLSKRMAAIQRNGKALGTERIAIMAALNITRELLDLQHQGHGVPMSATDTNEAMRDRLAQLQLHIESALDTDRHE